MLKDILKQRKKTHGEFSHNARMSQSLKSIIRNSGGWHSLTFVQQEALDMIQHKISRLINGDSSYLDTVVDIIGYATLMKDEMDEKNKMET